MNSGTSKAKVDKYIFINKFVSKCKEETRVDDFVVAHYDEIFGLTTKGINGGGSVLSLMMIRLSK